MSCVYILILADGKKYTGSTKNVGNRIKLHLRGCVTSTRNRLPIKEIWVRETNDVKEAAVLEKKYKQSHDQVERDKKAGLLSRKY